MIVREQRISKRKNMAFLRTARAIVTDMHFIIPLIVLIIGTALLVGLH
jgi:hypothetical protein